MNVTESRSMFPSIVFTHAQAFVTCDRSHIHTAMYTKICRAWYSFIQYKLINLLYYPYTVFSKHFVVGVALPRVGIATDVPSHLGGLGKSPLQENSHDSLDSWRYIFQLFEIRKIKF